VAEWLNIRERVYETLLPLGVPAMYMQWQPLDDGDRPPATYITYQEMLAQGELYSDDTPDVRGRYVLVDIWSVDATEGIAAMVREALEGAGFRARDERDIPEPETGTFHRAMSWVYYEEVGDNGG